MKKRFFPVPARPRHVRTGWLLCVLLPFLPGIAGGAALDQRLPQGVTEVTVEQQSATSLILSCHIAGFQLDPVTIEGDTWYRLTLAGEPQRLEKGRPDLPVIARSIVIPDRGEVSVRVTDYEYVDLSLTPVAPSKGSLPRTINPAEVAFEFGPVYNENAWPTRIAAATEPYILRDYRGVTLRITPAQYFPQTRTLRVFTRVVVAVNITGDDGINTLTRTRPPQRVDATFNAAYARHFLNFDNTKRYTLLDKQGHMLIIAASSLLSSVEPLADWKRQMGIPTTVVPLAEAGSTANNIKTYVQGHYNTNNLAWLLLVGDAADVPTLTASGGSSDPSFSKLAGSDNYPDIFVGRFSGSTAVDISNMVTRTIQYEKYPVVGGDWYHQATGLASDEGSSPSDKEHMDAIRTNLLAHQYSVVDQIYDSGASVAQVNTALHAGRGLINYVGHGDITEWVTTGFDNANINALTNTVAWPFIFDVACVNGQFDGYTCFAEAWLRASHNGTPSGALAIYASTINQEWDPPMTAQNEFNRLLTGEILSRFGALCFNASMKMIDDWPTDGVNMFNTWTIFGDPSVQVRTLTPHALSVSCASSVTSTTFPVTVSGETGALVALSQNSALLGSAYTDGSGQATIYLDSAPVGDVVLTVTALNAIPEIRTLSTFAAELGVTPSSMNVTLPTNTQTIRALAVTNAGEGASSLSYTISFERAAPTRSATAFTDTTTRNISGSTVNIAPTAYTPGSNTTFTITVTNASSDDEWLLQLDMDYPPLFNVTGGTDITETSGGRLTFDGTTGDGAKVSWIADDAWADAIEEHGQGTITIAISPEATGTIYIPWTLIGDDWGSAPHTATGMLALTAAGPPPPALTLTAPDGGESWAIGSTQTITWTSQNYTQQVNLAYSINGGTTWSALVTEISDSGSYAWTIPPPESTNSAVRISAPDESLSDQSATAFTLYQPVDWLTASQYTNTLSGGHGDSISITFDAAGKTPGTYQAWIRVASTAGTTNIPVTMQVTQSAGTNYLIMASCEADGTISPQGTISVSNGCSTGFVIQAHADYFIASVTTNGASVPGAAGLYTYTSLWENVWATGIVHATFASVSNETAAHGTPVPWLREYYTQEPDLAALLAKADEDTDGDGLTAWQECVAGTDPTNPTSVLQVTPGDYTPSIGLVISWPAADGRLYEIHFATNLTDAFSLLQAGIPSIGTGLQSHTDTLHQTDAQIFYRVQVENSSP
ncbi:MAG: hypothetical protein EOM20_01750 [Spartobacteria bacterium]|nr:hypothetical protein [Spartobacteria bacterium]